MINTFGNRSFHFRLKINFDTSAEFTSSFDVIHGEGALIVPNVG